MDGSYRFSVVPSDGEWNLLEEGSSIPLLIATSRADVVMIGKAIAEQFRGRLVVHRPDGGVEAEHSYPGLPPAE